MKELLSLTGGYKRHMDYLLTLQSEVLGVQNSLLKNLGHDLVLSGCEVTNNGNGTVNIASGVVYVGGEICRFASVANIPSDGTKALVKGVPVTSSPKEFQDGSTKNIYKESFAVVADASNASTQIVVKTVLYGIKDYIADIVQSYGQKGETKWVIDLDNQFLTNFSASGAGITPKWLGWHLMNGNAGTPSMAGRTPIGVGSFVDSYGLEHTYTNNNTGGQPRYILNKSNLPNITLDVTIPKGKTSQTDGGSGKIVCGGGTDEPSDGPTLTTSALGSGIAFSIQDPYRAGYWVIKL